MKTLKLLLLALLMASCSADSIDEDCNCKKITYTWEVEVVTGPNGLPTLVSRKVYLYEEVVNCQDEQTQVSNGDNVYFDIVCE